MKNYDIIIIGAGSVGTPTAMFLGEKGIKTAVIDKNASPGQGENKSAIGGIRATHSDPEKIIVSMKSLEIFSSWQEKNGDDIEWLKGGYLFPVYREKEEKLLKNFLSIQKKYGLKIDFISPKQICEIVPGIKKQGLIGGTFSPNDGSASPLLSVNAFYKKAITTGNVNFYFNESVKGIKQKKGQITGVITNKRIFSTPIVIDAAGPFSRDIGKMINQNIPVMPESHEGAITENVKPFFKSLIIDLRPAPGSKNYYFYQNKRGQIIFCITPDPPILGIDKRETSAFLPQVSKRMIDLIPRLKNIRVRRMWRGLYPMTPDGSPIVGFNKEVKGLIHATGMCGQGYMFGPGVGDIISKLVTKKTTKKDNIVLDKLSLYREFSNEEKFK